MGAYLSAPRTEKSTEVILCSCLDGISNSRQNTSTTPNPYVYQCAATGMQGWRKTMEDSHVMEVDLMGAAASGSSDSNSNSYSLFSVFDGHGGAGVARFCSLYMPRLLNVGIEDREESNERLMTSSFLQVDNLLRQKQYFPEVTGLNSQQNLNFNGGTGGNYGSSGSYGSTVGRSNTTGGLVGSDMKPRSSMSARELLMEALGAGPSSRTFKEDSESGSGPRSRSKPVERVAGSADMSRDEDDQRKPSKGSGLFAALKNVVQRLSSKDKLQTPGPGESSDSDKASDSAPRLRSKSATSSDSRAVDPESTLSPRSQEDSQEPLTPQAPVSAWRKNFDPEKIRQEKDHVETGPGSGFASAGPGALPENNYSESSLFGRPTRSNSSSSAISGNGYIHNPSMSVGATAVQVLLTPSGKLVIGNAGDSRAVLATAPNQLAEKPITAKDLSFDHKPNQAPEKQRIHKAGGFVKECPPVKPGGRTHYRVNGNLNLSRSIGDLEYKKRPDLEPEEQVISAYPDVTSHQLDLERDLFMILGCDGLWDVLSSQQACDSVYNQLEAQWGEYCKSQEKLTTSEVKRLNWRLSAFPFIGEEPCSKGSDEAVGGTSDSTNALFIPDLQKIIEALVHSTLSHDPRETFGLGGDNVTAVIVLFGKAASASSDSGGPVKPGPGSEGPVAEAESGT